MFEFHKAKFSQQVQKQFETEKQLRHAINENGELKLYLQSQVTLVEAKRSVRSVRWNHPNDGMISPGQFIPVAEQSDLIVEIDRWVITQVCRATSDLNAAEQPANDCG